MCVCVFAVSVELGLQQRMEYLSRAAVCAKSSTSRVLAPGDGEFLHDIEDKMEVTYRHYQSSFIRVWDEGSWFHILLALYFTVTSQ